MTTITGKALVLINQYSSCEPARAEAASVGSFTYLDPNYQNEDGSLNESWLEGGYMLIGHAEITVELLPQKKVTEHAVASLRKQKEKVIADAQAQATSIERQIQSLLAIEHTA